MQNASRILFKIIKSSSERTLCLSVCLSIMSDILIHCDLLKTNEDTPNLLGGSGDR